jgi:hypothetical protein
LQRIADETGEDIFFLALGKQNGIRAIHRQYLKNFWREEFEGSADPKSYQLVTWSGATTCANTSTSKCRTRHGPEQ